MAKPEITPELQEYIDEVISGLKDKNAELISEVRKLKVGKTIDPADMEKLETQIETLRADNAKLSKDGKGFQKAAEDAAEALKKESGFTQTLLIENGLTAELSKAGITNPQFLKAAQALLKGSAAIVADGDKRIAKIGDKDLATAVKEWAAGEEGKHFVSAPNNSGGNANGGGGKSSDGMKMSRSAFEALSSGQKSEFSKKGGTLTND
jgi:hypothetical protein